MIEYEGEDVTVTVTLLSKLKKPIGRNFYFGVHKIEILDNNILRLHNRWPGYPDTEDYPSESWERFVLYEEDGFMSDKQYIYHKVKEEL